MVKRTLSLSVDVVDFVEVVPQVDWRAVVNGFERGAGGQHGIDHLAV